MTREGVLEMKSDLILDILEDKPIGFADRESVKYIKREKGQKGL
jgi:hypothetical protein